MKVAKKLQAPGASKRLCINGLRDFLKGKSCRKTCRKSFSRETRSFRQIQKCQKSTKNIAKTAQIRRFERFLLELLGRFELPTSSLPNMAVFAAHCYVLLSFAEFHEIKCKIINELRDFSYCALLCIAVVCAQSFSLPSQSFAQSFLRIRRRGASRLCAVFLYYSISALRASRTV